MGTFTTIPRDSTKGVGGICYFLLCNLADVTIAVDSSMNTTITAGDVSIGDAFVKFVTTKETSNYTVTGTGTPTAGTSSWNQVLTAVFARNEALKVNQLKVMANSEMIAVVVDRNGDAWCLGNDSCSGLDLTSSTGTSGTGPNDLGGQTVTLSANSKYPESYVDAATLTSITPA